MSASMFVATLLTQIKKISNGFSDLVLGPLPTDTAQIDANHGNQPRRVPISIISELLEKLGDCLGQIVEVAADEPEQIDQLMDVLVSQNDIGPCAVLGVEKNRFWETSKTSVVMVMPSEKAPEMLFATHELLKSKAIGLIILSEILLKQDAGLAIRELAKLKALVLSSQALVVLINPNTSERRLFMGELQLICSRQFEFSVSRYSKVSDKV